MKWISVKEGLPEITQKLSVKYLVLVKRESSFGTRTSMRFGKWEKKKHRKTRPNESEFDILKESPLAKWVICNFKGNEVTHWMPLPEPPEK